MDEQLAGRVAQWLVELRGVAFCGAGLSTESGIPDFRSPGGIWSRSQPVYFQEFLASAAARIEYWRQKAAQQQEMAAAAPNVGHRILADWEAHGLLEAVITQNIDGLHQQAGSRNVLELHGTNRYVACLACARRWDAAPWVEQFERSGEAPRCPDCGGWLKHATVSFGQPLPPDVLQRAAQYARHARLLLVLGSSLTVEPAASLPRLAKQRGARLAIINRDPTPLDHLADVVIAAPLGTALSQIDACVRRLRGNARQ
jgi:NAD-dependent deacetylase